MGAIEPEVNKMVMKQVEDAAEAEAEVDIWKYVLGFVETAVVKCAIELGIADAIHGSGGGSMTLAELSSTLGCAPTSLYRIMRFLVHHRVFKLEYKTTTTGGAATTTMAYALTPLSRRLVKRGPDSMAALILLESTPAMLAPWHSLSGRIVPDAKPTFTAVHGEDLWSFTSGNPEHNKLLNDAMACDARVAVAKMLEGCPEVFDGIGTLVDVGGGDGTLLSMVVKACPWIRGINFDLPHVVSVAPERDGVVHVGGDMFDGIPKADAACFLKVLHDWGDEECIKILKKCREAIPEKNGKVIIIEAVIDEEEQSKLMNLTLMIDMVMIAHTNFGKERTFKEWSYVLAEAGFRRVSVKPKVRAVHYNIIEAFP